MGDNEQLVTMLEKVIKQNEETNKQLVKDNEFLKEIIIEKEKSKRTPWIVCVIIIVAICTTFLAMHFKTLNFFSFYDFSYEEINQDSAEGGGNNVYFPGENATYNEAPAEGE